MQVLQHFVLDTGPLLEFFILRYQAETGTRWWERRCQFHSLTTQLHRKAFEEFLRLHRGQLTTSPGVIAELQSHLRTAEKLYLGGKGDFRKRVWRIVVTEFRELDMAEDLVRILEMDIALVFDFGPVDAGLMELVRRCWRDGVRTTLLTGDRPLVNQCKKAQISACLVADKMTSFLAEF